MLTDDINNEIHVKDLKIKSLEEQIENFKKIIHDIYENQVIANSQRLNDEISLVQEIYGNELYIKELNDEINSRDMDVAILKVKVQSLEKLVNKLNMDIIKLNHEILELKQTLIEKSIKIDANESEIIKLRKESEQENLKLKRSLIDQRKDINKLTAIVTELKAENDKYKSHMDIKRIMLDTTLIIRQNSLYGFTRNDKFNYMLSELCKGEKDLEKNILEIYKKYNPEINNERLTIANIEKVYKAIKKERNALAHSDHLEKVDITGYIGDFEKTNLNILETYKTELTKLTDEKEISEKQKDIDKFTNIVIGISIIKVIVEYVKK